MSVSDTALRLIALAELKKAVTSADKAARADTGLGRGDRKTVRHPLDAGVKLGTVTMTDPAKSARVVDDEAFAEWMQRHYPDRCRKETRITGPAAQVIEVLRRHAPHLLDEVVEVADWGTAEVLRASEKAGEPCGPGGELDVPGIAVSEQTSTVQVRPTADAASAIAELWRSGALDLDGTVRALPGPDAA